MDRVTTFHELHRAGLFVIPNPWDVGSARLLEGLGFKALATTSSGFAWTLGRPDNRVTLHEALAHMEALAAAVRVPVSADFEGAFAIAPEGVAANVALAARTGVAGLSVEDASPESTDPLLEFELSVERIRAAREAIDGSGSGVLLTARSEGFIVGRPDLGETIRRLVGYGSAGADCLFAPGVRSLDDIRTIVRAVAPRPVNVLVGSDFTTVRALAECGVRRISVGGALARAALSAFLDAAAEIAGHGTFTALGRARSFADVNSLFAPQTGERS